MIIAKAAEVLFFEPVNHFYAKDDDEFGFFTFKVPVTGVGPNDTSVMEIEAKFASWQPEGVGTAKGIGGFSELEH